MHPLAAIRIAPRSMSLEMSDVRTEEMEKAKGMVLQVIRASLRLGRETNLPCHFHVVYTVPC